MKARSRAIRLGVLAAAAMTIAYAHLRRGRSGRGKYTHTRYLALDAILPGDVIVSSARTLQSALIRAGTGSLTASHAAIALHPLIWFESVGSGVRYQIIEPQLVWDGKDVRLAMPIPVGERYLVRRPVEPLCSADSPADRYSVAKKLIECSTRFAFLNYARPSAFLATLRLGLSKSQFARFLAAAMDRDQRIFYPGPFCSWLVAECYNELGRDILGATPQSITPAAIARSSSLVSIEAELSEARPIDDTPRTAAFNRDLRLALGLASAHIGTISNAAIFAKGMTSMNEHVRGLVTQGWNLSGTSLPPQAAERLDEIEEQQRANFGAWQTKARDALNLAYASVCAQAEQIEHVARCHARCCASVADRGSCSTDTCVAASRGYGETVAALQKLFPDFGEWEEDSVPAS